LKNGFRGKNKYLSGRKAGYSRVHTGEKAGYSIWDILNNIYRLIRGRRNCKRTSNKNSPDWDFKSSANSPGCWFRS